MNKESGLGITHYTINDEYKLKLFKRLEILLRDITSLENIVFIYADAANSNLNYHLDDINYGIDASPYLLKIYDLIYPLNNNIKIIYYCWYERISENNIIEYIPFNYKQNWYEVAELIKNNLIYKYS